MSEKSKNNSWQIHLKKTREENKGMKPSELFKLASKTFKEIKENRI